MVFRFGRIVLLVPLLGLLLSQPASAGGPSFDCAQARSPDERAVCHDDELARLDTALDLGFRSVGERAGKHKARRLARGFLAKRRRCGGDRDCIREASLKAIAAYRSAGALLAVDPPAQPEAALVAPVSRPVPRIADELSDRNRRFCHFTMAGTQRYDGKPHDMAKCLAGPKVYVRNVAAANEKIAAEWKAQGKASSYQAEGRPLVSRMVLLYAEVSDFRAAKDTASLDQLGRAADILERWSASLKEFKGEAKSEVDRRRLAELRAHVAARFESLYPDLRRAFARALARTLKERGVTVDIAGAGAGIITLSSPIFAANQSDGQNAVAPWLLRLRFKEARFKAKPAAADYAAFKLNAPADSAIALLADGAKFEQVF